MLHVRQPEKTYWHCSIVVSRCTNNIESESFVVLYKKTCSNFLSAAQFDVDYLERISTNGPEPSALTRQSLYVKFDPLVGKDSPNSSRPEPSTGADTIIE